MKDGKRERGDGRIFLRKASGFLYVAYYRNGVEQREPARHVRTGQKLRASVDGDGELIQDANFHEAERFLKRRLGEVIAERHGGPGFVGTQAERIVIRELVDALEADYKLRGKDSAQNLSNLKRVRQDFGMFRATSLTVEQIDKYIEERVAAGAAKASINRVTQLLGQAYKLAIQRKRLVSAPFIRHLSEAGNVRQGFFSESDFRAVIDNLPGYLKDFARFAYCTGMRKGEIASLRWEDVDADAIKLRAEDAKNGEGRSIPIEGEVAEIVERRHAARRVKKDGKPVVLSAWIFHHDAEPVGDFRKAWATACVMAGLGKFVCPKCEGAVDADNKCANCSKEWEREELRYIGRIFHDFRRTAVRDMVRAGVPETVAMSISGHRTRSMFDRYNISSERDRREALRQTHEYRLQQAAMAKTASIN